MANRARGEVEAEIGGERVTITLGLGALAELEDAFDVESFEDALAMVGGEKVRARHLRTFMLALLRGNRALTPAVERGVDTMSADEFMAIVLDLFKRSGIVADTAPAAPAGEGTDTPLEGPSAGGSGSQSASGI